jgi:hypothetical protein
VSGRTIGSTEDAFTWYGLALCNQLHGLAATRFSGRRAPAHPGGAPNCPDYVMTEAYSHECSSVGFWVRDRSGLLLLRLSRAARLRRWFGAPGGGRL